MDTLNSLSAIVTVLIFDTASKMPKQDPKTLKFDWSPDKNYTHELKNWVMYVFQQFSIECAHSWRCKHSYKIIRPLLQRFPGLVSRNYNVLMPSILLRPDISTHDCLIQANQMDDRIDHTSFKIRTQQQLDEWLWVCHQRFLSCQIQTGCM